MALYDFKVRTNDSTRGSMGVVEAKSVKEAEAEVREQIAKDHPDLIIRSIVIRPSIGVKKMRQLMQGAGMEFKDYTK